MFEFICKVKDLGIEQSSSAFSYESITEQCDMEREVEIKYYNNSNEEGDFIVSDSLTPIGDTPTIMVYVRNEDTTYNVYRYKGELEINRQIKQDILTNINEIISQLKEFLNNNSTNQ